MLIYKNISLCRMTKRNAHAPAQTMITNLARQHTNFYLRTDRNKNKNDSQQRAVSVYSATGRRIHMRNSGPSFEGAPTTRTKKSLAICISPDRAPDSHTSVQPGSGQPFPAASPHSVSRSRELFLKKPIYRPFPAIDRGKTSQHGRHSATPRGQPAPAVAQRLRGRDRLITGGPHCGAEGTGSAGFSTNLKCNNRVVKR